jgi:hypothetical protein
MITIDFKDPKLFATIIKNIADFDADVYFEVIADEKLVNLYAVSSAYGKPHVTITVNLTIAQIAYLKSTVKTFAGGFIARVLDEKLSGLKNYFIEIDTDNKLFRVIYNEDVIIQHEFPLMDYSKPQIPSITPAVRVSFKTDEVLPLLEFLKKREVKYQQLNMRISDDGITFSVKVDEKPITYKIPRRKLLSLWLKEYVVEFVMYDAYYMSYLLGRSDLSSTTYLEVSEDHRRLVVFYPLPPDYAKSYFTIYY